MQNSVNQNNLENLTKVFLRFPENWKVLRIEISPKVTVGSLIQMGDLVARFSFDKPSMSDKLLSPSTGFVRFLELSNGEQTINKLSEDNLFSHLISIEKCTHSIIFKEVCTVCFESRPHHPRFIIQDNLKVSYDHSVMRDKKESLMVQKKMVLLLDLDNTMLHSMQVSKEWLKKDQNDILSADSCFVADKENDFLFVVKRRPFFKEFRLAVNSNFEVFIYTFGTRAYAERVISLIDAEELLLKVEL